MSIAPLTSTQHYSILVTKHLAHEFVFGHSKVSGAV